MFGLGFTEILIIAVIAILFLGPDKLPTALVDMAKFFRSVKKTIGDVKDSIEQEMNVSEMKEEALAYKKELLKTTNEISDATKMAEIPQLTSLNNGFMDDYLDDDDDTVKAEKPPKITPIPENVAQKETTSQSNTITKAEEVTFEKKSKQEEIKDV
jgi:sec-independent protein translocase protein TatB